MIDLYYDYREGRLCRYRSNANEDELKLSIICRVLCCGPRSFSGKEIQEVMPMDRFKLIMILIYIRSTPEDSADCRYQLSRYRSKANEVVFCCCQNGFSKK